MSCETSDCSNEIHLNDIGTILRATINDCDEDCESAALDVSGATTLQIILKSPTDVVKTKNASFTTDGTDGQIEYTTVDGDLDEAGEWAIQAYIVFSNGSWRSSVEYFKVHGNL